MRISFVLSYLLCTTCMLLASNKSFGQKELDKNIRVNFKNVSLREALEELQTRHQIPLAYNNNESVLSSNVNYSGNKMAKEVLTDILKNQNMTYEIRHGFVRLVKATPPPHKCRSKTATA